MKSRSLIILAISVMFCCSACSVLNDKINNKIEDVEISTEYTDSDTTDVIISKSVNTELIEDNLDDTIETTPANNEDVATIFKEDGPGLIGGDSSVVDMFHDKETGIDYEVIESGEIPKQVSIVPMHFKENYQNLETYMIDISKYGDKNICLSEIYAYIADNPSVDADYFDIIFQDYLDVTGIANDDIVDEMIKDCEWDVDKGIFDAEEVFVRMRTTSCICLLHINHPSIYGTNAAYIVLTGLSFEDPKGVIVRDPNQNNLERYAVGYTEGNEPVYAVSDIIGAASDDSECWIFYLDERSEEDKNSDYYYKNYSQKYEEFESEEN